MKTNKEKKYNLVSWDTWKRTNKPKVSRTTDMIGSIVYSVYPTLLDYGFRPIYDEYSHMFKETAKNVAIRLIDDWFDSYVGTPDISKWEFVYYKHRGYDKKGYPDRVEVYGKPKV